MMGASSGLDREVTTTTFPEEWVRASPPDDGGRDGGGNDHGGHGSGDGNGDRDRSNPLAALIWTMGLITVVSVIGWYFGILPAEHAAFARMRAEEAAIASLRVAAADAGFWRAGHHDSFAGLTSADLAVGPAGGLPEQAPPAMSTNGLSHRTNPAAVMVHIGAGGRVAYLCAAPGDNVSVLCVELGPAGRLYSQGSSDRQTIATVIAGDGTNPTGARGFAPEASS